LLGDSDKIIEEGYNSSPEISHQQPPQPKKSQFYITNRIEEDLDYESVSSSVSKDNFSFV